MTSLKLSIWPTFATSQGTNQLSDKMLERIINSRKGLFWP